MQTKKETVSIFVQNQANVLTRVVSLFGRRGYNIDSLTVSATNDPEISRITIVFNVTDASLKQIITQTEKLEVVREIFVLESENSVYRELLLVKVATTAQNRCQIKDVVDIYRGKIISLSRESIIIELTGNSDKIDSILKVLSDYEILDISRTGTTGMSREN
ncbi:MAG: acetolactate synthase small subunit [Clostridiales bacterium]|jgi:acetolactate synthase-1/3 small subunit|nr:acetolactate synthase small subunit [Clostridiales bacterium]